MAKKINPKITAKSLPEDKAKYFMENIDNPDAYKFDDIFRDVGNVTGIYNDLINYGGPEGLTAAGKFLENTDINSNYIHGQRQNPNPDDPAHPGIVAYKGESLKAPLLRNSPEAQAYRDKINYGLEIGTLENIPKTAKFGKRWDNRLKTGKKSTAGENAGMEQPGGYAYEFSPDGKKSVRLPEDVWEQALKSSGKDYNEGGLVYEDPMKTANKKGAVSLLEGGLQGGVAGMLGAGLEMLVNRDKVKSEKEDWSSAWGRSSVQGMNSYKKGGEVDGKGGPKDDAIQRDVEPGSFIIPAENAKAAKKLGEDFLEWDGDQSAKGHSSGNKVNLSDGEVLFTRDEKAKLESKGIDLSMLAPDGMKGGDSFKTGTTDDGVPFVRKRNPYVSSMGADPFEIERENTEQSNRFTESINKDLSVLSENLPDVNDPVSKAYLPEGKSDNLAKYAGIAQAVGGAFGAIASGSKPSPVISDSLRKLSSEAIRDAGYGLPESVKNEMRKNSARTFRSAVNEITNKGGSAHDVYNKISGAMSQKISADNQTEIVDYQEKQRKKQYAGQIGLQTDQLKTGLERDAAYRNDAKVAGWMDVLDAGIHNVIGVQQSKDFSERYKDAKDQPLYMTLDDRKIQIGN